MWELQGRDKPQLGRIRLSVGANPTLPADVRHGTYDVIAPAGQETFTIAPGTRYVVEVWASDQARWARRTEPFTIRTRVSDGR